MTRRPSIAGRLTALVIVFSLGLAGGIGLERYWLAPIPPAKAEPPSLKQRLIGTWLAENGSRTEFKADGTLDETFRETVPDIKPGEVIDDQTKLRMVERAGRITGQYDWVEDDTIQVRIQSKPKRRLKLVVDGEELTILEEDGKVARLKRSK